MTDLIFQQGDDVLVKVLLFCSVGDILKIATVSRHWSWASNRKELWDALCKRRHWPAASSGAHGVHNSGKRFYVQKLLRTHMYATAPEVKAEDEEKNLAIGNAVLVKKDFLGTSGLMSFFAVPGRSFYSWEQGKYLTIDQNLVVLAFAAPKYGLYVWDYKTGKISTFPPVSMLGFGKKIEVPGYSYCAISTNYIVVAKAKDAQMAVIDLQDVSVLHEMHSGGHTSTVTCIKVFENRAASCAYDLTVKIWDLQRKQLIFTLRGHWEKIWTVDLTDAYAASGGDDQVIRIWDLTHSGNQLQVLTGHVDTVMIVKFDPSKADSRIFSSGYDGSVKHWDFQKGECLRTFSGHSSVVFDLCVDDYVLVSVGRNSEVIIWDRHSGRCIRRLLGHTNDVKCVDILSDSCSLISGSYDNRAICWKFNLPASTAIPADEEGEDEKA